MNKRIKKIKNLNTKTHHLRVYAEWGYYSNTYNAPKDGYLKLNDGHNEYAVEADCIEDIEKHLQENINDNITFDKENYEFIGGNYLNHGQYTPSRFKICVFKNK